MSVAEEGIKSASVKLEGMKQYSPQKLPYVRADNPKRRLDALKLEAERSKELARLKQQPDGEGSACRQTAGRQKASGF